MSKKIEAFWQDATAKDVERVMAGETVEARFRDDDTEPWSSPRDLQGWSHGKWISSFCWSHCQVYREPSWFTNKPDPGPGWRLLEKFPDEELKPGDEVWFTSLSCWEASESAIQAMSMWYRRRIEPVEPEPKHYVLRVGDSVETPNGHRVEVISRSETQRFWSLNAGDKLTLPNGQTITITAKGFEVTQ
jgi:hypothetical protein